VQEVSVRVDDQEYAPVPGLWELREAVASLYNRLFRRGMPSQYSAENVSICGGGRASLTRAAASLGHVNLGHFLPDYTAYEELLDVFKAFTAIPISSKESADTHSLRTTCARRSRDAGSRRCC
jgi:aspartate/methionine/tyrosine aminotransferase